MTQSTTMTIRLETQIKEQLDQLAKATRRSKSYLASEAIREYIELNAWQVNEIRSAISEADAGDFASNRDVNQVLEKWDVDGD